MFPRPEPKPIASESKDRAEARYRASFELRFFELSNQL